MKKFIKNKHEIIIGTIFAIVVALAYSAVDPAVEVIHRMLTG